MKKIITIFYLIINSSFLVAQTNLTVEGIVVNNTATGEWAGYIVPRNVPTTFTYRNNSITSVNTSGYMIQAGDEGVSSNNNNLDGEIISGNKFIWNGTDMTSITHGIFTGYNINAIIKYNYLDKVPMGIIRKSNGMTNTSGAVAYNIIISPNTGIVVKGMSGVNIYNNTLYSTRTTSETWRPLIDIYANDSFNPAIPSIGTKIKNNIFYTKYQVYNISIESECASGFESDYNIFYCESGTPMFQYGPMGNKRDLTFAQWQALGYDTHSRVINPNFGNTTDFVPAARLDFGTDLGAAWQTGLANTATWALGVTPATTNQNGTWQVGARIYEAISVNPSYISSVIENATPSILEMTYSLSLANIIPATSAFNVQVNSITRTVNSVAIVGGKVRLTLASPVLYGNTITVTYTKPSSNPLQTASGGQSASLISQTVLNNCTAPVPVFNTSVVENATPSIIEITYSLNLANIIPAASAFSVLVNSVSRLVSSVAISGIKVKLTLASAIKSGEIVTVSYTKPVTNPLQTSTGGEAASISAQPIINNIIPPVINPIPATIKMTISPNPIHRILNMSLEYAGSFSIQDTSFSPQTVKILDLYGKLFIEKLLTTGVSDVLMPINLKPGIYTVLIVSGGVEMTSQKIMVY